MTSRPYVPDPPALSALDPWIEVWPSGRPLIRCHHAKYGATEFNPGHGKPGRFSPFQDSAGHLVPFLYCADSFDGAISETVFQGVPVRGPSRAISRSRLLPMLVSTVVPMRDLALVQLRGHGLRRLQVSRVELIEADADQFERTVAWARALHAGCPQAHGLLWTSRQHDSSQAVILFGDRLERDALEIASASLSLYEGPGFEKIGRAAEQAGIAILA